MVKRLKRTSKAQRKTRLEECKSFATAIINSWKVGRHGNSWDKSGALDRNLFPRLTCQLDDAELVRRFVSQVMPADGEIQLDKSFVNFCKHHGWANFEAELSKVLEATTNSTVVRNAELLRLLGVQRDQNAERVGLCRRLSGHLIKALQTLDEQPRARWRQLREIDRKALLTSLVAALLAIDAKKPLSQLIKHTLACEIYDLTDAHLAAIFSLESRRARFPGTNPAILHWIAACRRKLEKRTATAPKKPTDYQRPSKLSCECPDCQTLSTFLADPKQRKGRFPLAKERRRHLHNIIDSDGCDCTHATERRGRPYTLVCTKTTASYDEACKIHKRDMKNLFRITALAQKRG
jgi:hypothetical protein